MSEHETHETLEQALAGLVRYPRILRAAAHSSLAALGPWTIEVNCSTGSGILGTRETVTFTYEVDFAGFRTGVREVFDAVIADVEAFWPEFEQVQEWMASELEQVSSQLAGAADGADSAGLADLDDTVQRSKATLECVDKALNALLGKLSRHPSRLNSALQALVDESHEMFLDLLAAVNAQPCGKDDALSQFSSHQAELTRSMGAVSRALATMRQKTVEARHQITHLRTWLDTVATDVAKEQASGWENEALGVARAGRPLERHAGIAAALHARVASRGEGHLTKPFHDEEE